MLLMIGLLISFCATLSLMIVVLVRTLREHPIFSLTDYVHIDWRLVSQHMFIINLLYTCVLLLSKSESCQAYGLPRYVPPIPGRHPPSMRWLTWVQMFFEVLVLLCVCWNAIDRPRSRDTALSRVLQRDGITFFTVCPVFPASSALITIWRWTWIV